VIRGLSSLLQNFGKRFIMKVAHTQFYWYLHTLILLGCVLLLKIKMLKFLSSVSILKKNPVKRVDNFMNQESDQF